MKKLMLPLATALLFSVAAFAQSNGSQGTPSTESTPSMQNAPDQSGSMSPSSGSKSHMSKKEMKGCIEQQNGQYVLQTKRGKDIALTGEDVSAHVGHTVVVHGAWGASAGTETSTNGQMSAGANHAFNVTSVKMVSDTCQMKSKSNSGMGMGNGSGSGAGTGSGTTQPQ